jgi:hypothetical protein
VPERGVGKRQPGGWIYATLPFVEEGALQSLGTGLQAAAAHEAYSLRLQTPLQLFTCPTRRPAQVWPITDQFAYMRKPKPFGEVTAVARADYAINAGSSHILSFDGPASLAEGEDASYWAGATNVTKFSGISHLRLGISIKSIVDGTSKTYLVGEKHLAVDLYSTGSSPGDNESMYSGYCTDLHRFAGSIESLKLSLSPLAAPLADGKPADTNVADYVRFGSAHYTGINMAHADGAVHHVTYDMDPELHLRAGHRHDGGADLNNLR